MEIGKCYKHKDSHSFLKVTGYIFGYFRGVGFYKNRNGAIGIGDSTAQKPDDYQKIELTEFIKEFYLIKNEMYTKIEL